MVLLRPGLRLPAASRGCSACREPPLLETRRLLFAKTTKYVSYLWAISGCEHCLGVGYERGGIRDLLPKDLREGVKRRQGCLWLLLTCFGKSFFPKTPGEEPLSFFKTQMGRRHSTRDTEEFRRERENKHTPKSSVKKTNRGFSSCQSFPLDSKCFL